VHTVAVLSLKGGVGKTTVVLGLASAAMRRGVRTLVVDLDPQCNATACLEPDPTAKELNNVLESPDPEVLRAAISRSGWGDEVDILVGSEDAESHNGLAEDRLTRLATALSILDKQDTGELSRYQLILLDCPPSLGGLTRSALVAADHALLVTEPTIFAVSGVQRAFEAVQKERVNNSRLQPLGVVVNRVRPRSHEHQFRTEELREIFGPLVMPVSLPDRLAVQQAQGACIPIHLWGTPGAREVALAFNLLLARTLRASRSQRHAEEPELLDDDEDTQDGDTEPTEDAEQTDET
jgi:cellulose biosynthesis protein BcsQ